MASTFIRSRDADTLLSMQAFADGISAAPALYQLSAVDAASIAGAVSAYAVALGIATNPATRTKTSVTDKDQARNAAEAICRQYANLIKYSAGISDADKQAIGVEPVNLSRDARECPQTSPSIIVVASTQGAQTLQFRDSINPESRGKPFGATELLLWVAVGETIAASHEAARFYGSRPAQSRPSTDTDAADD